MNTSNHQLLTNRKELQGKTLHYNAILMTESIHYKCNCCSQYSKYLHVKNLPEF